MTRWIWMRWSKSSYTHVLFLWREEFFALKVEIEWDSRKKITLGTLLQVTAGFPRLKIERSAPAVQKSSKFLNLKAQNKQTHVVCAFSKSLNVLKTHLVVQTLPTAFCIREMSLFCRVKTKRRNTLYVCFVERCSSFDLFLNSMGKVEYFAGI